MRRNALALIALAALVACEKKPQATMAPPAGSAGTLRIAVVPKGTTHDFWKSIHAGAVKAERDLPGVKVTFQGPQKEDDREQQVSLVENLISARFDAIVLAPLDDRALVAPVRQATAAGIPVVIIDSGLQADVGHDFVSYIATDNYQGGRLAGERMVSILGGGGRVLMLRYQEGSASTAQREQGFLDAASETGLELIDPKRYAGATRATAQEAAENLLSSNADLAGIFCPNESSTFGMLLALQSRGLAGGRVKLVGFDASEGLVDALRSGDIDALVVQNPMKMGYLGVRTAVAHIRGEPVETQIDTGVAIITRETMDTPEHKELLAPDLASYLGGR